MLFVVLRRCVSRYVLGVPGHMYWTGYRERQASKRAYPSVQALERVRLLAVAANGRKVVRAAASASSRSRPSLLVAREFRHSFWGNALKDKNAQLNTLHRKKGLGKMKDRPWPAASLYKIRNSFECTWHETTKRVTACIIPCLC